MPAHRTVTAALLGAVVALAATQVLDAVAPSPAAIAPAAASTAASPSPATAVTSPPPARPGPTSRTTEPMVIVVPAPAAEGVDLGPVLHRLDALAAEIAEVRTAAGQPPTTPVVEVVEVEVPGAPETEVSYEWACGEDCTYVTSVLHTEGNEAGGDAGDIDAVTYVCVAPDARATDVDDDGSEAPPALGAPAAGSTSGDEQLTAAATTDADTTTSSETATDTSAPETDQTAVDCGDVSN